MVVGTHLKQRKLKIFLQGSGIPILNPSQLTFMSCSQLCVNAGLLQEDLAFQGLLAPSLAKRREPFLLKPGKKREYRASQFPEEPQLQEEELEEIDYGVTC